LPNSERQERLERQERAERVAAQERQQQASMERQMMVQSSERSHGTDAQAMQSQHGTTAQGIAATGQAPPIAQPVAQAPAPVVVTVQTVGPAEQAHSLEWMSQEDCSDCLVYTVCASANDQNLIALHVGVSPGQGYTNCCDMYFLRYFWLCGGLCTIQQRANVLKKAFSDRHGLNHQPISMSTAWCCPEIVFRQIKRKCIARSRLPSPSERPHLRFGRFTHTSADESDTPSTGVRLRAQGSTGRGSGSNCAPSTWSAEWAESEVGHAVGRESKQKNRIPRLFFDAIKFCACPAGGERGPR
jgi:hypothetical protein